MGKRRAHDRVAASAANALLIGYAIDSAVPGTDAALFELFERALDLRFQQSAPPCLEIHGLVVLGDKLTIGFGRGPGENHHERTISMAKRARRDVSR